MKPLTLSAFRKAARGTYGNISAIARKLAVPRSSLYDFIRANPDAGELIVSLREEFDDLAEEQIRKLILEGDRSLLRFYASTRLRARGYRKEEDAENAPPEIRIHLASAPEKPALNT